jgi:hypothetical protein
MNARERPIGRLRLPDSRWRCCRLTILMVYLMGVATSFDAIAADSDDTHPLLTNNFSIAVGLFYPDRSLNLGVNGSVGDERDAIDFDNTLRLGEADEVFSGELAWRFHGKWSLLGQYFKSSDAASVILGEDIEWEDIVFGAGTNARAGAGMQLTRIFLGRELRAKKYHDFGVGGGIHWLDIGAFIEGTIIVDGEPTSARGSVGASAPLPNIGVWYRYSISLRWAFRSRLDLFDASVAPYDGSLINASVGVDVQALKHLGIGLAYNYFELDVGVDKSNWRGEFQTSYKGAFVYASGYF